VKSRFISQSFLTIALFPLLLALADAAKAQTPEIHTETGMMNGASYRIDMPAKWNGVLLVYYHGYAEHPVVFANDQPEELATGLASAGFEVIQSGYSEAGFAVEAAMPETEALRRYAIVHYGQPKETYALGHSMGGHLTMISIESYPNRYDGALPLCGLLEPTTWAIERSGAMLAAFHYYYPGLLPGPVGVPESTPLDDALMGKVQAALHSNPKGLAEMMALGRLKSEGDLASGVVFATFIERDFEKKIGAPILNNENHIYTGGADDNALNDGVKRYRASEAALAYMKTWYSPTGVLLRPVLAVHTTYDPLIPPDSVSVYADLVERMGSGRNFVQQYVKADGHCNISGPETAAALTELITWKRTGERPKGGLVPVEAK
jgi:pimeloyl-ACP methyl ester carboxylesterase